VLLQEDLSAQTEVSERYAGSLVLVGWVIIAVIAGLHHFDSGFILHVHIWTLAYMYVIVFVFVCST